MAADLAYNNMDLKPERIIELKRQLKPEQLRALDTFYNILLDAGATRSYLLRK